jgi:hypothetical protein
VGEWARHSLGEVVVNLRAWAAAVAAWAAVAPALAQQEPKPAQIDRNGVMILIRETLLALDQANKTGNYTVLRDLGSPAFQANTAARLGEIFATERHDNLDLSGVAVLDPQLSLLPQIEANGLLHMSGFFPSAPEQVNFDVAFAPVNGQWKLFGSASGSPIPDRARRQRRPPRPRPRNRRPASRRSLAPTRTATSNPQSRNLRRCCCLTPRCSR